MSPMQAAEQMNECKAGNGKCIAASREGWSDTYIFHRTEQKHQVSTAASPNRTSCNNFHQCHGITAFC